MGAETVQSRRQFLRSIVDGVARSAREVASPLRRRETLPEVVGGTAAVAGPGKDRERAGTPAAEGEIVAALNDLSGIYEP